MCSVILIVTTTIRCQPSDNCSGINEACSVRFVRSYRVVVDYHHPDTKVQVIDVNRRPPPAIMTQRVLDVDTILGLPRPTRKASTLKKPHQQRQPPPHINKQRALAIEKKFKITQIGKVSVRAAGNMKADSPPVSLQSEKVTTRKLLLDRRKGLETAMNTKDSSVGKCLLGRNNYETRKLEVESERLNGDSDRRKYQLLKQKSVFVHQRGLILTQKGIIFDPNSASDCLLDSQTKQDSNHPIPNLQVTANTPTNSAPRTRRHQSPAYMRPLICNRTRSTDSQVAEVERFLASPAMRQYTKTHNGGSTISDMTSVSDVIKDGGKLPITTSTGNNRVQSRTKRERRKWSKISESTSSIDGRVLHGNVVLTGKMHSGDSLITKRTCNRSTTHIPNRQISEKRILNTHGSTGGYLSNIDSDGRVNKSLSISSQTRQRTPFFERSAGQSCLNQTDPAKDPRFTELTSFLVADSAKAFDLYRAMGRLSVLNNFRGISHK